MSNLQINTSQCATIKVSREVLENIESNFNVMTQEDSIDELVFDAIYLENDEIKSKLYSIIGITEYSTEASILEGSGLLQFHV